MENYFHTLKIDPKDIPEVSNTAELIQIGIFQNNHAASHITRHLLAPKYRKIRRTHIYQKKDVVEWLEKLGRIKQTPIEESQ
jgi:hypothetical protein